MPADPSSDEVLQRILLLVPTRKDAEITSSLLVKAGIKCAVCADMRHLAREIQAGAAAVLLTEEVLADNGIHELLRAMKQQPSWSDLPVVMLMQGGVASPAAAEALSALTNVTLIDRPAAIRSVLSAVQAAARSRHRQYQIRDQLEIIRAAQDERQVLLESERAARHDAERANRIKDEFLATLSHELRTPLNAIFGWAQIMKLAPGDSAMISEGINVIDRNVRVQTQLIEDLLDMSRIISGKLRLDLQRVKINEVVEAALESVRPSLTAKEIQLETAIDPAAGPVIGDPSRLQQVLWNLLSNAIKFTPHGGTIRVAVQQPASRLEISVTDTGEGIPPEFLPQLFERFTQANASMTRKHGGLGLGLSIVRNLIEMHGGAVRAESPGAGHGATFTVELPLTNAQDIELPLLSQGAASHSVATLSMPSLKGLKVLVVDDDDDARELVRRFLIQCEATPTLASSAAEAQTLLKSFQPDVIISDIGMPLQDGYEFMRAVRVQGLKTPAVALTAFARPEDRIRSIQAGYQMHLSKPVEPMELIAAIASLAGRYQA